MIDNDAKCLIKICRALIYEGAAFCLYIEQCFGNDYKIFDISSAAKP